MKTAHFKLETIIDFNNAHKLKAELKALIQTSEVLYLDSSSVDFIDSTGLGALASLSEQASTAHKKLILVNPTPPFQSILEILRLDSFFTIEFSGQENEAQL